MAHRRRGRHGVRRAGRQDRPSPPARRWSRCCASPATSTASPTPTQRMANFYEKGDKPLEIVSTRQWYIRNGGRDAAPPRAEMVARGDEIEWIPAHMKHRYDNWVERPQRRLADLPAAVLRHPLPGLVPPRRRRASPTTTTRCCRARPSCRSTRRTQARGGTTRPARQARRLRRRPRRDGHLGDLVADPPHRRRLGARRRPLAAGLPLRPVHPRPRHHPHLAVQPRGPRPLREPHGPVAARPDLRVHRRPRPQEDVEVQGQRRRPDRHPRAVRRRRRPVARRHRPPRPRLAVRRVRR